MGHFGISKYKFWDDSKVSKESQNSGWSSKILQPLLVNLAAIGSLLYEAPPKK